MALHTVKKGLDIPISGGPEQRIDNAPPPATIALVADDSVGMRPTMFVAVGDAVKRGQLLYEDKKTPGVVYTSPGAGAVLAINRGERRAFQTVVIQLNDSERSGNVTAGDEVAFDSYTNKAIAGLSRDDIKALLVESGLWTAFRTRPFSKVPALDAEPDAIFVTAMSTDPLAPSADVIFEGHQAEFEQGLLCLVKLCEGTTYLCRAKGSKISADPHSGVLTEEFTGLHPAGTAGFHIHTLYPVSRERAVWHINFQDVIAIGRLFATGKLDVERIISLAGPAVKRPRLLRTRLGASTDDLVRGELEQGDNRVVSGSVLSGRTALGEVHGYLGRYHHQISVLREGRERQFLGWMMPGFDKFSVARLFASSLFPGKKMPFTTAVNGSIRAMIPFGFYEDVMPMQIMPTFLLRAMMAGNIEKAEQLGCLELDEEDLALCSFVCAGKIEYGEVLRDMLETIEKEG